MVGIGKSLPSRLFDWYSLHLRVLLGARAAFRGLQFGRGRCCRRCSAGGNTFGRIVLSAKMP